MLRAIGMSRAQLTRLMLHEAGLLGLAGGVTAAALGAYVSYCWVMSTLTRALGWIISVHVPWSSALLTVALGLAVGAIAGLLVSMRTSHIQIREALTYE
jgi:ABC-type antimicrobial peptide transport system permease subunit